MKVLDLLLYGGPHEVAPEDVAWVNNQAARWVGSSLLKEEERERIRLVWVERQQRPALQMGTQRRSELDLIGSKP